MERIGATGHSSFTFFKPLFGLVEIKISSIEEPIEELFFTALLMIITISLRCRIATVDMLDLPRGIISAEQPRRTCFAVLTAEPNLRHRNDQQSHNAKVQNYPPPLAGKRHHRKGYTHIKSMDKSVQVPLFLPF